MIFSDYKPIRLQSGKMAAGFSPPLRAGEMTPASTPTLHDAHAHPTPTGAVRPGAYVPASTRSTAGRLLTERRAAQWLRCPSAAKCAGRSVSA